MHGDVRCISVVPIAGSVESEKDLKACRALPRRLSAFRRGAIYDLHCLRLRYRHVIRTDAHKLSISLVEFEKVLIGIEFGKAENEIPFGQPSKIRTRQFIQRIEKESVDEEAPKKTGEEICED